MCLIKRKVLNSILKIEFSFCLIIFIFLTSCHSKENFGLGFENEFLEVKKDNSTEDEFMYDSDDTLFNVEDIKNYEGYFLIVSTSCGSCFEVFSKANLFAKNNIGNNKKFIALLVDPFTSLKEYKKGEVYKIFGFLDNSWIVFSSDELISILNKNYDLKKKESPILFYREKNETKILDISVLY